MDTATGLTGKEVKALLTQAVAHLNRNEVPLAEAALATLLDAEPEEPDALHMMAGIRRTQGRAGEAETLYTRSLAAKPDQPFVHHALGNLLRLLGRADNAIAAQREAIRLKPNYAEAWLDMGLACSLKGDPGAAEKCFRNALRLQPNFLFAKQALGATLNDLGRPKEAEVLLRQTLALGIRDTAQLAVLEHNLGVSAKMQGRYEDALRLFDSAQTKAPDMRAVDYNRGNALQHMGRLEEAAFCYHRAIARNPLDLSAHRDFNHLLYRMGNDEDFLRSYDDAMALYPDIGMLPLAKGEFLFLKEDYESSRGCFERAAPLLPGNVSPRDGLGLVLGRLKEYDAAIGEHEAALKIEPQNAHAWRNFAETLIRAGDLKRALAAAEESRALEPEHQGAIAMQALTLRALGDPRAEYFDNVEDFVQVFELEPPQGYSDMESFNRDLDSYLDRMHRDKREIISQSVRGGTQTIDNLFGRGHALVELLRARIDEAVRTYIARMKDDREHPLLRRRRAGFSYSASWSSRLNDNGYHINHIHPAGWISSAYYVSVPEAAADANEKQGWIKFGEPYFDAGLKNPVLRTVQPKPGTLVLFPSYMWHGTVPFRSPQSRTAIAFDVLPE